MNEDQIKVLSKSLGLSIVMLADAAWKRDQKSVDRMAELASDQIATLAAAAIEANKESP